MLSLQNNQLNDIKMCIIISISVKSKTPIVLEQLFRFFYMTHHDKWPQAANHVEIRQVPHSPGMPSLLFEHLFYHNMYY